MRWDIDAQYQMFGLNNCKYLDDSFFANQCSWLVTSKVALRMFPRCFGHSKSMSVLWWFDFQIHVLKFGTTLGSFNSTCKKNICSLVGHFLKYSFWILIVVEGIHWIQPWAKSNRFCTNGWKLIQKATTKVQMNKRGKWMTFLAVSHC